MFNSFKLAFSMYSRIPMPRADWSKEKMKYVMAFFPLVGVAVGGGMLLWNMLVQWAGIGELMSAVGRVLVPLLLTGGIHMDGFLDTIDARRSYQSFEKKLEILKDPHTGAFAIIYGGIYLLAMLGLYNEVSAENLWVVAIGFVLSRSLSGISVVAFKGAKNTGTAADFRLSAEKRKVFTFLICIPRSAYLNFFSSMIFLLFPPLYDYSAINFAFKTPLHAVEKSSTVFSRQSFSVG